MKKDKGTIAATISKKNKVRKKISLPDMKTYYSYCNQDGVILAELWAHVSLKQNREFRNAPIEILPNVF